MKTTSLSRMFMRAINTLIILLSAVCLPGWGGKPGRGRHRNLNLGHSLLKVGPPGHADYGID